MLELEDVEFQHPNETVCYEYSLKAERTDIVGIMGASGSGKSTLLELVAGFLVPKSGKIAWDGNDLGNLQLGKRPVTILFQSHNLFEHLTVVRNIAVGINPNGAPSKLEIERTEAALSMVGLDGLGHRLAANLSGGQKQRVALARAFVRPQPIVLLDEPFTGLDDDTKADHLKLVSELAKKQNKCVLMVTHDASDAEAVANQLYKIEAGKLAKLR